MADPAVVRLDTSPGTIRNKAYLDKAKYYLRMFLQDTPALNKLIVGEELKDEELEFAIEMCISDWNSTSPLISPVQVGQFPSLYLLMHGSAVQALKMAGIRMSRNELNYQSGGSSFMRWNKTASYQSWISMFYNDYEMKKRNMKISQNVMGGYGQMFSEYWYIGYW